MIRGNPEFRGAPSWRSWSGSESRGLEKCRGCHFIFRACHEALRAFGIVVLVGLSLAAPHVALAQNLDEAAALTQQVTAAGP
jgi:hypothetical protein